MKIMQNQCIANINVCALLKTNELEYKCTWISFEKNRNINYGWFLLVIYTWNSLKTNCRCQKLMKQVRTNIGLADTLIPSSVIYLIYMGGTGLCDSIQIIFGYHVNS